MHSLFSSTDLQGGLLLYLTIACTLTVLAAVIWRVTHAGREIPREERAAATLAMMSPRGGPRAPAPPGDQAGGRAPENVRRPTQKADTR